MMSAAVVCEPVIDEAESTAALYEVVGDKSVKKDVSAYRSWIGSLLSQNLGDFVESQRLGTVVAQLLFILEREKPLKRRPDVAFVSSNRWAFGQPPPPSGDWDLAPDLAVEVVSPNERYNKVMFKMDEYFAAGVEEVWLVSPEARIIQAWRGATTVQAFGAGDQLKSDRFPGWSFPVAELLPNPAVPVPSDE